MQKLICDRCGKEIPYHGEEQNAFSFVKGHAILKISDLNETWCFLDLCEDCREAFKKFLLETPGYHA